MASPNADLEKYLAQHVISNGKCSCGWDIANYDIEPYGWEEDDKPARRRAWVAHVERVWRDAHPLGQIQQATTHDPNGDEVVFDMEPGHDTLSEEPQGLGRRYHGEYRYADYEPPPQDQDDCSEHITCEEAGCRDPHCLGGHYRMTLSLKTEVCSSCGEPFKDDEERVGILMQAPEGRPMETGTAIATTATYHRRCRPSGEALSKRAKELWPTPEQEKDDWTEET